jgi:hypothetical protein
MDYLGFIKNFNIRIPLKEEFEYYIDTLSKSAEFSDLKEKLEEWKEYENSLPEGMSPKEHMPKVISNAVSYLKELIGEKVKECANTSTSEFSLMNFVPEDGHHYVSFDTRQGNWTVIRKAIEQDLLDWEEYTQKYMGMHMYPILSKSKGLRQTILGQVCSSKHYTKILKSFTQSNLDLLDELGLSDKIVGIKEEEVFLDLGKVLDEDTLNKLKDVEWGLPTKGTLCKYEHVVNFGKHIVLEHHLDIDTLENTFTRMKDKGGDGNKFYLNFKTLILKEKVDQRDLITRKDKIPFMFCGEDYSEQTEYKWIERWAKPLYITNNEISDYVYYDIGKYGKRFASVHKRLLEVEFEHCSGISECESLEHTDMYVQEEYLNKIKEYFNV